WGSAPNNPVNPENPEILSSLGDQWGQSRLKPGIGNREGGIDKAIRPLPPPPDFINSRKSASPFPIPNDSPFPIADSQGEGGGEWERQSARFTSRRTPREGVRRAATPPSGESRRLPRFCSYINVSARSSRSLS